MTTLRIETLVYASIERCFSLSLSVDAHTESMGASGERAIAGVTSGEIGPGQQVTWRARHFGIPFRMTSRISAYDAPKMFVDEQVRGPFKRWRHEHRFEPFEHQTLMTDVIEFAAPCGPLGRIIERMILEKYMFKLIHNRNQWLKNTLEG